MSKRGENIYKRKDGRWEARYSSGIYKDGRSKYHSIYGKSYKEVKEKLSIKLSELRVMTAEGVLPNDVTITDIINLWLDENRYLWKESTYGIYRGISESHIIPEIGSCKIKCFSEEQYQLFFMNKQECGSLHSTKGLSGTYLKQIEIILNQVFKYAGKKYGYLQPQYTYKGKAAIKEKTTTPPYDEVLKINNYLKNQASNNATCLGILLCFYTGIRLGELCALQWKDIDFKEGTLHITKTMQRVRFLEGNKDKSKIMITSPKSVNSNRIIPIPNDILEKLKLAQGKQEDFIVEGMKKKYAEPRTLQYRFKALLKEINIPTFNFHMLRHIFASTCMINGFDMKSLSELLGHSNIQTTLNLYVHSNLKRKRELMENLAFTW